MDDVLVTGLGALSPLGAGTDAFWRGMHKADTAPSRVPDPLAHMDHPLMYLVPEADIPDGPEEQDGLPLGRGSRFALAAAREAVADAGLAAPPGPGERPEAKGLDPRRVAVALSTGMGDTDLHEGWWTGEAPASGRWAPPSRWPRWSAGGSAPRASTPASATRAPPAATRSRWAPI
ncbi:beta-ketoacyl synthase N-terminal-like domain-containing protein [Streptomyces indonesiensis]